MSVEAAVINATNKTAERKKKGSGNAVPCRLPWLREVPETQLIIQEVQSSYSSNNSEGLDLQLFYVLLQGFIV